MDQMKRLVEGSDEWFNHIKSDESTEAQRMFSSESYFRSLWENAPHGMAIVSEEGRIIDGNPAFCRLLGIEYDSCIGLSIKDFVADGEFREDQRMIETMVRGRMYSGQTEERWSYHLNQNGPYIPIRLTATRIPANLTRPFRHIIIQVHDLRTTRYNPEGTDWGNKAWGEIFKTLLMNHFGKVTTLAITILILLALSGHFGKTVDTIVDKFIGNSTQYVEKVEKSTNKE